MVPPACYNSSAIMTSCALSYPPKVVLYEIGTTNRGGIGIAWPKTRWSFVFAAPSITMFGGAPMDERIRVVSRPTTHPIRIAPLPFQDAWIGIELPLRRLPKNPIWDLLTDELRAYLASKSGWNVPWAIALEILSQHNPQAAEWYRDWGKANLPPWVAEHDLLFNKDAAERLTSGLAVDSASTAMTAR